MDIASFLIGVSAVLWIADGVLHRDVWGAAAGLSALAALVADLL